MTEHSQIGNEKKNFNLKGLLNSFHIIEKNSKSLLRTPMENVFEAMEKSKNIENQFYYKEKTK